MLDQMFMSVVCPLFFAETMSNLAKEFKDGKSPGKVVAGLAERTPVVHSYMNTYHVNILLEELHGESVAADRRPIVAGGIPVKVKGKAGLVYEESPEAAAFGRWQDGRFREVEHIFAKFWRDTLGSLDLTEISAAFKSFTHKEDRPRNHRDAHLRAKAIVDAPGQSYKVLLIAHRLLGLPPETLRNIVQAWKNGGSPPLRQFAPFAAHCLEIELYFSLALSNGIISDQRASNRIDIGYLYYTPFANIFVSGDKLHRTSAEHFLAPDQRFVWGPDLKKDLAELSKHFLALPEEERAAGVFTLVKHPPVASTGLCSTLWDQFRKGWREPKAPSPKMTKKQSADIIGQSNSLIAAAERQRKPIEFGFAPEDEIQHMVIQRMIPTQRGSWRTFSKETEEAQMRADKNNKVNNGRD